MKKLVLMFLAGLFLISFVSAVEFNCSISSDCPNEGEGYSCTNGTCLFMGDPGVSCIAEGERCSSASAQTQCCFPLVCSEEVCVNESLSSSCVGEGDSVPVIVNPPECCDGLTLVPPTEPILGSAGSCELVETNCVDKCGDGNCDEVVCQGEGCYCAETSDSCAVDCSVPILSEEGEFCGGIAGIQCASGLECKLDGDYPDAGGVCKKSGFFGKSVYSILLFIAAVVLIFISYKLAKWFLLILALIAIALAFYFIFLF